MPIATATEYKAYIGESGTGFDTLLGVLIASTQAGLERACGRVFDEATYTDLALDGNGEGSIWLPHTPVSAVSAVKTLSGDGTETAVTSTDYRLNGATGELRRINASDWGWGAPSSSIIITGGGCHPIWPYGTQNLLVTFTAGYADNAMPTDLKLLLYQLIDAALDRRGENWTLQQAADGIEQRTALTAAEMVSKYEAMIRPWKRMVV